LLRWQLRHLWVRVSFYIHPGLWERNRSAGMFFLSIFCFSAAEKYEFSFISTALRFRL